MTTHTHTHTHTTPNSTGPRLKDQDKPDSPRQGNTRPDTAQGDVPRTPNEHDESADSQASPPREVIQQASQDLKSGRQDTDKGPPMDAAYQKLKP